jgi:hypothetical protein
MMRFRKTTQPRLSATEARRQGEISHLAFLLLGRERAIAFLNADNPALGGRPLDLAIASTEGCAGVEAELARLTLRQVNAS